MTKLEPTNDTWTCHYCGSTDPHHQRFVMDDEIEVDVTCEMVYFLFNDESDDPGMSFDHETFEEIIEHFEERPNFEQ